MVFLKHFSQASRSFLLAVLLSSAFAAQSLELASPAAFAGMAASNGASEHGSASADLNWIAFDSTASNLVIADQNQYRDVFLFETLAGNRIISQVGDAPANGDSSHPDLSADGEWLVFQSNASNLTTGDHNGTSDIFVYQRSTQLLRRLTPAGAEPNGPSTRPRLSASGQRIVFLSEASNWVANDVNGMADVFVYDLPTNQVTRASVRPSGVDITDHPPLSAQISGDGLCVSIESRSELYVDDDLNGIVDYFVTQPNGVGTRRASVGSFGEELDAVTAGRHALIDCSRLIFHSLDPRATPSGFVTGFFLNDNNINTHLPLADWASETHVGLALSRDHRFLVVGTDHEVNLPAVQEIIDLQTLEVTASSTAHGLVQAISNSGDLILKQTSRAVSANDRNQRADLVLSGPGPGNPLWISAAVATESADLLPNGASGLGQGIVGPGLGLVRERRQAVSGDGRFVLFSSMASNLVSNDLNEVEDVFVRDRLLAQTTRVGLRLDGSEPTEASTASDLSADGRWVLFESCDSLGLGSSPLICDLFMRDTQSGAIEQVNVSSAGTPGNGGGAIGRGHEARMSQDARVIVFTSVASNLVAGPNPAGASVFVRDRLLGSTELLGLGVAPMISRNGQYVIWIHGNSLKFLDRQSGSSQVLSLSHDGLPLNGLRLDHASVSNDGRYVAFDTDAGNIVPGDRDERVDVFVHDRHTQQSVVVSQDLEFVPSAGELSPDGIWLSYLSDGERGTTHRQLINVDWRTGRRHVLIESPLRETSNNQVAHPRFSADSTQIVALAAGLPASVPAVTGDLAAVYVLPSAPDRLFASSFETTE